jgi:hypothetical protein
MYDLGFISPKTAFFTGTAAKPSNLTPSLPSVETRATVQTRPVGDNTGNAAAAACRDNHQTERRQCQGNKCIWEGMKPQTSECN